MGCDKPSTVAGGRTDFGGSSGLNWGPTTKQTWCDCMGGPVESRGRAETAGATTQSVRGDSGIPVHTS